MLSARRLSLRATLRLGFGSLLLILLAVTATSVIVLTRYNRAFERLFHENHDSVMYCNAMKDALDAVNRAAIASILQPQATRVDLAESARQTFSENAAMQRRNSILPGEAEISDSILSSWQTLQADFADLPARGSIEARRETYRLAVQPRVLQLREWIDTVSRMNLRNMVEADGRVRATLYTVRDVLLVVAAAGTVLAVVVLGAVGRAVLKPLSALTRSAQRIADGELDQSVKVETRDEVGQLADAFNVMAARLREFRRLDQERLTRTEQTTQMAIDSLPDAVAVLSPDGRVELVNRVGRETFGFTPGNGIPSPDWMRALHAQVMQTGSAVEAKGYRSAIQRFDQGDERFYLPQATPLKLVDGRVVGVTVILTDVTRLKQADEARRDLVSTVSHELKTPLTSIRMATHMLSDQETFGPLSVQQAELLKTARDNTERLHRTVEHLLGIGRIESGSAALKLSPMSAAELISNAVDPLRSAIDRRGLALTCEPTPAVRVNVDSGSVGYVLTNLLNNTIKYVPPGGTVKIQTAVEGEWVRFTVADNGPGMPPEYLDRLFNRFFRVPQPDAPPGAGLGLAIAREIVDAHGGAITAASEPGNGATFSFTLPLVQD